MDFGVITSDTVTREFLAVVLAGFGNELLPLTSDHGGEPCPKSLLPVANKPILDYTLSWIEKSGIRDVLLICPITHRSAISHHIHSDISASVSSLRVDLQTYDESQDTSVGTCTLLRHFSSRISGDFVLLPCDFISPSSLPLSTLLNNFRTEASSDGSIATTCWFEALPLEKGGISNEWGPPAPLVSIIWDEYTRTLLHIDTPDDLDRNGEELELRMSLLSRYPRSKLAASFQDSHVYVCRRSVLDVLLEKHHFDSFREEFLPWLCKAQYQRTKREKYGPAFNALANTTSQAIALQHSTLHGNPFQLPDASKSPISFNLNDPKISSHTPPYNRDTDESISASPRVSVVIHRAESGFAARINTIHSFLDMNRHFLSTTSYSLPTDPASRGLIDQRVQISGDSMIADSTKVDERTTIKKSVIGKHCIIGKMAKIFGCVVFDHCVIEDGAKLDGCILGKNTTVGANAELIHCITQAGYEVGVGETFKHEKLDVSDWMTPAGDNSSISEDE